MSDVDLRALQAGSAPLAERRSEAEGRRAPPEGDGESGSWLGRLALPVALILSTTLALGVASTVGPRLRSALLIEVQTVPRGDLDFRDSPAEAAGFFAVRDTVTVVVPRDMTVATFLALHRLETNPSAREALDAQLGVRDDDDLLREGDEVTFALTLPRPGGS